MVDLLKIYNEISEIINYYINNPKEFLSMLLEQPVIRALLFLIMNFCIYSLFKSIFKENN